MTATNLTPADPSAVLAIARSWLGTPYLHQSSVQGVGCDCLGLARGIWRALHGNEPWEVPPYSRDWGEAGRREVLAEAARAALIEIALDAAGPGTLILFRMVPGVPTKHCGLLGESVIRPSLIHAYDRSGVVEEAFTPAWARRATFAFQFPVAPSAAPANSREVI
jgi:NlpC/P60 family putative phage cell wall peptidase